MDIWRKIKKMEQLLESIACLRHATVKSGDRHQDFQACLAKLAVLEQETGYQRSDSPLETPDYPAFEYRDDFMRPVLPVKQAASVDSLLHHAGNHTCMLSLAFHRPVVRLLYQDGILADAFCLRQGNEWHYIMPDIDRFANIPLRFPCKGVLKVDGYAVFDSETKQERCQGHHMSHLTEKAICEEPTSEKLRFYAAGVDYGLDKESYINSFEETVSVDRKSRMARLLHLKRRGFAVNLMAAIDFPGFARVANPQRLPAQQEVVRNSKRELLRETIEELQSYAVFMELPASGVILSYDDMDYSMSLASHDGKTPDRCFLSFEAMDPARVYHWNDVQSA